LTASLPILEILFGENAGIRAIGHVKKDHDLKEGRDTRRGARLQTCRVAIHGDMSLPTVRSKLVPAPGAEQTGESVCGKRGRSPHVRSPFGPGWSVLGNS